MDTEKKPKFSIRLAWLFGLLNTDLIRTKEKPREREPKHADISEDLTTTFYILRTKGLLKRLFKLLKDILRRIKIKELNSDLKVALDNPADTGILFSLVAPINLLIRSYSPYRIMLEPSFDDNAFLSGYFHGTARMRPIRVVPSILGFVFSSPAVRASKKLISFRWRGKKR